MDAACVKKLDLTAGSTATRKSVAGINNLFVNDLFGTGGNEMEQRVSKLAQKIGTMLPLLDREFLGHTITKLDCTLKLVKKRPSMSWSRSQWNET